MKDELKIERMAADAMTEKVIRFSVSYDTPEKAPVGPFARLRRMMGGIIGRKTESAPKERQFAIAPPSLGKMQILSSIFLSLDFSEKALEDEPHLEAMRVCRDHTDKVCRLMAVAVRRTRAELNDEEGIQRDAAFFRDNATPDDFGHIMLAILTQVEYQSFINSIRLRETYRLNRGTGKGDARIENPS